MPRMQLAAALGLLLLLPSRTNGLLRPHSCGLQRANPRYDSPCVYHARNELLHPRREASSTRFHPGQTLWTIRQGCVRPGADNAERRQFLGARGRDLPTLMRLSSTSSPSSPCKSPVFNH
eukprot:6192837-Pleurochrysis_carterae.AAC.1